MFLWTPPHFWALALMTTTDYHKANVPMLPNVRGTQRTKVEIFVYSVILVAVSLAPNLSGARWGTRVATPALFADSSLASRAIASGDTVLALPFGIAGDSMYWQVQDRFRFRLAGGYLSISLPPDYRRYIHLITALEGGRVSATADSEAIQV